MASREFQKHSNDAKNERLQRQTSAANNASEREAFAVYLRPRANLLSSYENDHQHHQQEDQEDENHDDEEDEDETEEEDDAERRSSTRSKSSDGRKAKFNGRTSRFLSEADWEDIFRRIANGEKQVELAREYKISRSAISNMKVKFRKLHAEAQQTTTTSNTNETTKPEEQSPMKPETNDSPRSTTSSSASFVSLAQSRVVQSYALTYLLDQLEQAPEDPTNDTIRILVQRIIRLLLEEALANVSTENYTICSGHHEFPGVRATQPTYAIAVNDAGKFLLDEFRVMERHGALGTIYVTPQLRAEMDLSLPRDAPQANVLLLASYGDKSAKSIAAVIECLLARGITQLQVVLIVAHASGIDWLLQQYPELKLVVGKEVNQAHVLEDWRQRIEKA